MGLNNPEYNDDCFSKVVANDNSVKFYFGDKVDDNFNKKVIEYKAIAIPLALDGGLK